MRKTRTTQTFSTTSSLVSSSRGSTVSLIPLPSSRRHVYKQGLTCCADVLLNCVEGIHPKPAKIIPFAVEASWATGRWETLAKYLEHSKSSDAAYIDFDVAIGEVFRDLQRGHVQNLAPAINSIRERIAASMGLTETASLQACHDIMLRCHVLADIELVASAQAREGQQNREVMRALQRRLGVLGSHVEDKQYLLSIQRAAIELRR